MDDRNKKIIAIGVGVASALICCVVALLVFMVLDPFGWFGRLFGGGDPIAEAMPPDSDLYIGMDMAEMTSGEADDVVRTIINSVPDAEPGNLEDVLADLVDEMLSEFDLTFEVDIMPWIGRGMGIALTNFSVDQYGGVSEPDIVFAIQVRDDGGANGFITGYIEAREYQLDEVFSSAEYRGATIYELESSYSSEAIARSGEILYFGSSGSAVRSAIDAQKGESLADDPAFENLASQFPEGRFATIYFGSDFLASYADILGMYGGGVEISASMLQSLGMTITFTDFGLQLDMMVGMDEDQLDDAQRELYSGAGGDIISMFSEDTLAFFVGQGLDAVWENLEVTMGAAYGTDFGEAMEYFEDEYGIRPDLDLFPILDGEWGILIVPGAGTEVESEMGGLGIMLMAESSQGDELESVVSDAANGLEQSGLDIRESSADGGMLYTAESDGAEVISFGTQDGVLLLGTNADVLIDTMQGSSSLEESRAYRDVLEAFPRGTTPVLYIDLNSVLSVYLESGSMDWDDLIGEMGFDVRPFTHLAVGSSGLKDGVVRATVVIMMDME